jgi:hypothetical protein
VPDPERGVLVLFLATAAALGYGGFKACMDEEEEEEEEEQGAARPTSSSAKRQ